MNHLILLFMFSFFVFFSQNIYAKTEQSLSEYKIEQLQKNIDEIKKEIDDLKKDVDDTKEKKLENKKDNESLDKRVGDISGSVDRFGIEVAFFAILITVVILSLGYFAYRGARNDAKVEAKNEAESITKNWLEKDGKEKLNEIIQDLQSKSEKEFNQLVNEKTVELNTLLKNFKQEHKEQIDKHENEFKQKMKEHYTVEEKEEIEKEAKTSQEKDIKTFEDYWNIILQHYTNKEFNEILSVIEEAEKLEDLTTNQKGQLYFVKGFIFKEQKEYEKAEKYYLQAIESGDNDALINLGLLYKEQKEYEKAEKYYLQAIEKGNNDILFNLGLLYKEQKEYEKAEKYYLQAIKNGHNGALNNLAYMYFSQSNNKEQALKLVQESYEKNKSYINIHTLAIILLWNEEFSKSYEKFEEWMEYEEAFESLDDISEYINLLISKGQYYKAKEYFENEKYQLKDRLKPIWYALMTLMQDEFPNEIKKMGSELQTSVDDILETIEQLKQKYKI